MPVIKRYSNRKLYDTESKRYVTLEDLADFIRQGEEVRVIDHVTGEDLTSLTLIQVILEEEKKIGGLLPQVFMTRLIRAGSGAVDALRSRVTSIDPFRMVDDEIRRRIQSLVEHGLASEEEAQRMRDLLLRKATASVSAASATSAQEEGVRIPVHGDEESAPESVEAAPDSVQEERVDQEEVNALLRQVDDLEMELQRLKAAKNPSAS